MRIILKDIEPDDWILAIRAAKYLKERFQQDAWLAYGEHPHAKEFYAKRNKASITVRACSSKPHSVWASDCEKYPGCKCDDICLDSGGVTRTRG